jgi:opacity protein-like surface antigen
MKHLMFSLALLVAVSSTAMAIGPNIGFGAHANFTNSNFPGPSVSGATNFKDAYGMGLGGGVHLDIELLAFSFRLSGDYLHYSLDQDKFRDAFRPTFGNAVSQLSIDGGGLGIYALSINGKMSILPLPIITPYLTGGVGLAWLARDEIKTSIAGTPGATTPSSRQSGKNSLNIGAGVDLRIGVELFLEVKYVWMFTEGENSTFVPLTVGITF